MNADIIKQLREAHHSLTKGDFYYSPNHDYFIIAKTPNGEVTKVAYFEFWRDMDFFLCAAKYFPQLLDDAEELLALNQTDYRHEHD